MAITNQQLKYLKPLFHLLFWILLLFLPSIIRLSSTGFSLSEGMQNRIILNNVVLIAFFYLNAYYLYPVLYKKRSLWIYIITLIALVFSLSKGTAYLQHELFPSKWKPENTKVENRNQSEAPKPRGHHKGGYFYYSLFPYIFIIGISISYRIIRDTSQQEKVRKEQENEHLKAELTFLRSQVSPHFMFNVLNTLVSLARKKSDLMEPSLIQLSHLMRYMLYESNDERITLDREVEYLRSYIDLQLLRFGDDLDIQLTIPKAIEGYEIEPMLLISFVENAFKHGVGMVENPFIKINLSVNPTNHWLNFIVENSISPAESAKDKSSGIGLMNVRRRLELLYKDRYKLETSQNEGTFVSKLNIRLK